MLMLEVNHSAAPTSPSITPALAMLDHHATTAIQGTDVLIAVPTRCSSLRPSRYG
uniref:Uncharacterized protein n=1 Tax=Arundo donax TaxID=35708 RepID=A0A0A9GTH6_ARUDO